MDQHYQGVWDTEAQDWDHSPQPYDMEQAKEVADLVVKCMEAAIKAAVDAAESFEKNLSLRDIRTAQGVGIVLEGMLNMFRTNNQAYGEACDGGAAWAAYYYLEDF